MKRPPGVTPPEPEPTRPVPVRGAPKRERPRFGLPKAGAKARSSEDDGAAVANSDAGQFDNGQFDAGQFDAGQFDTEQLDVDQLAGGLPVSRELTGSSGSSGSSGSTGPLARVSPLARFGKRSTVPGGGAGGGAGSEDSGTAGGTAGSDSDANATVPLDFARTSTGHNPAQLEGPELDGLKPDGPKPDGTAPSASARLKDAERARRRYERNEAKRFTVGTRRRRIKLIIAAGITAALVLLVVLTAYSPLLSLRTIEVQGTSRIDPAMVVTKLDDQVGRPLSLIDFGQIERTLESFPLVQSYVTETRPPDTLVIKIVERQPVASVQTDTGYQLIDPVGVIVESSQERVPGYPLLDTAVTPKDSKQFAAIGAVMLAIPVDLRNQIQTVLAETPDSIRFIMASTGNSVLWGSSEQSPLKARILTSMLAQPELASSTEIDVSSPEAPVVR